jgi:hypothetical protein
MGMALDLSKCALKIFLSMYAEHIILGVQSNIGMSLLDKKEILAHPKTSFLSN